MFRRKQIKSKKQSAAGLELEKSGDITAAIKLYQKATVTDPTNHHAWNRLMILYRKTRSKDDEGKLINDAINNYQEAIHNKQEDWAKQNTEKAENTRELAQVLGLLEPTGLPKSDDTTIEKWQTRLYLLEYRIKNARKTKTAEKKPKTVKPKTKPEVPKAKQKPKKIIAEPRTKK